ncbi:MAG: hypothetical protein KGM49_09410 [Sphingomonadales bacterium]|nr:hypothetical protein [Sphingomonadales bacterium]
MAKYKLKPEHEARFPEWRDRWIANAMSTEAMTEDDRDICRQAVLGMYEAAKLPPPKHIVFVQSPFVLAFAGGFAASIWHRSRDATRAATEAATRAATEAATEAATRAATEAATWAATRDATRDATEAAAWDATRAATEAAAWAATRAATEAATRAATWAATRDATEAAAWAATRDATEAATRAATRAATEAAGLSKWYVVPADMRKLACELRVGDFGLQCAANAYRMWSGGNQWGGYDAYLSFFQDVAQLPLDYSAYNHWRALAEHSGPRIMHPDFCMISDRPEVLTVDAEDRPHGEAGPFCRWRDGSALYSWHGARVPARWIENRATLDPAEVLKEQNVELRAAGASIVGWPKMLSVLKAKVIDDSGSPDIGQLIELKLPGLREAGRFLKAECPRNGIICEGVPLVSDIDGLPINTALAAQAWRVGDPQSEYCHPPVRT